MWTQFMDMNSGGGKKEAPFEYIYIEAPENEAEIIFFNRFGHNPNRVTCTCCGNDYSISESSSFDEATKYSRRETSVEEHESREDVLVIPASEIKDTERTGELPAQGYVWQD